jgi:hypothetical protein
MEFCLRVIASVGFRRVTHIVCYIAGDDLLFQHEPWDAATEAEFVAAITKIAKQMGLCPEGRATDYPEEAEFCSARWWCVGPDEYVPGPKIGRRLARFGWAVLPMPKNGWLRSLALGAVDETNHIPILRAVTWRLLKATKGQEATPYVDQYRMFKASQRYDVHAEIYTQIARVYGLSKRQCDEYERTIARTEVPGLLPTGWARLTKVDE